jgi:hypothetical protein
LVKGIEPISLAVSRAGDKHHGGEAMRKFVLTTLAALTIGTAAFAHPADAACWWNGFAWHCWPHHSTWRWHHHHPYSRYYGWGYGPHGQGYWHP